MHNKSRRFHLLPYYTDRIILAAVLILAIFGAFMIGSAEMSVAAGDMSIIIKGVGKQLLFVIIGLMVMAFLTNHSVFHLTEEALYKYGFWVVVVSLLLTRAFPPAGGAYAWIRIGPFGIQPSEFAKVYIIILAAKLLGTDHGRVENYKNFLRIIASAVTMVFIIFIVQKDFGSALVLAGISFIILLVPRRREFMFIQSRMLMLMVAGIVLALFILSPLGTKFLANFGGYQIGRFLSSADPFKYQFNSGYHLVMSLVSFTTGGLFGLGYGCSIHKYMNFPNPDNDFILPVIVEELGLVFGFIPVIVLYGMVVIPLMRYALKTTIVRQKIVFVGVFMYFSLHFILNVGGVSGLIPLTGVPLLLLSSGGSSALACLSAIGIAQSEIIIFRRSLKDASSSGEI